MPNQNFIAITYGEFQAWYNYGELRIIDGRIRSLPLYDDGLPKADSKRVQEFIEHFPNLSLEDEEGVLVIQLKGEKDYQRSAEKTKTSLIPISRIEHIIPLTERARRILETRLTGVRIESACIERPVREAWFRMAVKRALRGGDLLVDLLFQDGLSCISVALREAVQDGIAEIDYKDDRLGSNPTDCDKRKTCVPDAFAFTRSTPYKNGGGELDYFRDAAAVLSDYEKRLKSNHLTAADEVRKRTSPCRDALIKAGKALAEEFGKAGRLVDIVKNVSFTEASEETQKEFDAALPLELKALVLFLRWKTFFHKQREEVDVEKLAEEIPDFISAVGFDATVTAVWLLGCFAGYERIAPAVYALSSNTYSWHSGPSRSIERIKRSASEESLEAAPQTGEVIPVGESEAGKADPPPDETMPSGGDTSSFPTGDDKGTPVGNH